MEAGLIDAYVATLHARLRWRPDVDDVLDEVADHLRERAERLMRQGMPVAEAEARALESFGRIEQVARAFAVTDSGGVAVPSRFTRLGGLAGLGAGAAWTASMPAAATGGHTDLFTPWSLGHYQVWVAALMTAMALTTLALAGALLRIGRLRTLRGGALLLVGTLLVAALTAFGWAVTVITATLGLSVLVALHGSEPALARFVRPPRALTVWLLGGAALLLFDEVLPIGRADEYGDHPVAWMVPFLACALCSAVALALLGARLWAEHPAEVDDPAEPPAVAAAG